jgi:hypothetical protein
MKQADIRTFVETLLRLRGGEVREAHGDLLRVILPAGDGRPEAPEHLLAFGTQAHRRHPEAELVAIGSAFLDRLISEATSLGRFTVVFAAPPSRTRRPASGLRLPRVSGREWGTPIPASRPVFLFVYVAEYHLIDVPDDLAMIAIDPARREVRPSVQPLLGEIRGGRTMPVRGWPPLSPLPTPGDIVLSLDALESRLQRRARHVKEASAIEIARETANIEAYYRQLILEVRAPVGRGQLTAQEETDRVRVLQLDWKRRVQEVSRFWEARGDVRLSALAAVMEPCWAIPLEPQGRRRGKRTDEGPYAIASCRNGALERPRCAACGAVLAGEAEVLGRDLVCGEHLAAAVPSRELDQSEPVSGVE